MAELNIIKIIHPEMGTFLEDVYDDKTQFTIFLDLIHSCLELKNDLDNFNGENFLIHIPYKNLRECIIIGNPSEVSLGEYAIHKSKMEGNDDK